MTHRWFLRPAQHALAFAFFVKEGATVKTRSQKGACKTVRFGESDTFRLVSLAITFFRIVANLVQFHDPVTEPATVSS